MPPREVYPGRFPESEAGEIAVNAGDAELEREVVVEDVAALRQACFKIDTSVPSPLPVPVLVVAPFDTETSAAQDLAPGEVDGLIEPGEREEDLGDGARGVLTVESAVEHGPAGRTDELRVALRVDPVQQPIRVEGRSAREGEQGTVARIDGDDRPHMAG